MEDIKRIVDNYGHNLSPKRVDALLSGECKVLYDDSFVTIEKDGTMIIKIRARELMRLMGYPC